MDIGAPELLIILAIVVLVFGVGRLGKLGGELGEGLSAFRRGLKSGEPGSLAEPRAEAPRDRAARPG